MKAVIGLLMLLTVAAANAGGTEIRGKLLGYDGKPMALANVNILKNMHGITVAEAKKDGAYKFSTDERGLLTIEFTGVGHRAKTVDLLITDASSAKLIIINTRLAANTRPTKIDSVVIIGGFNEFDFKTGKKMTAGADGVYRADFDKSAGQFEYQLLIFGDSPTMGQHSINGTQSDSYKYDGGGDYRSVLNRLNGTRSIAFDPKIMPLKTPDAKADVADEWQGKFVRLQEKAAQRKGEMQKQITASYAKNGGKIEFDPEPVRAEILKGAAGENNTDLRALIMMNYMAIPYCDAPDERSRKIAAELLGIASAKSPLWYDKEYAITAISMTGTPEKYGQYIMDMHKSSSDTNAVPWAMMSVMRTAETFGRKSDISPMYALMKKYCASSKAFSTAKRQYDSSKAIEIGNHIPTFSFISIDNAGKQITNKDIQGKYTLIDLWAVWCGPCRGEMPHLHEAYEKYKGNNFEILSVSFDKEANDVTKFRTGKWKMPWLHAFSDGIFESKAGEIFEVTGIPKPILVSPDGIIVAMESELRGDKLDITLTKFLKK